MNAIAQVQDLDDLDHLIGDAATAEDLGTFAALVHRILDGDQ